MPAKKHTRLINMLIRLCDDTPKWPNVLFELKYRVQMIERTISMKKSAQKVSPDVVTVSKTLLHAIVAECKGGNNIDSDQDRRYRHLESGDLAYHVSVHAPERLTHVVCYVDTESNHASLAPFTQLPFITFGHDHIQAQGDFKNQKTTKKLRQPISLQGTREPTGYYPFSACDDDRFVTPRVLAGLMSYLIKRGRTDAKILDLSTADEILKITHFCYDVIDKNDKHRLKNQIQRIIGSSMRSNAKFKEQITKIESGEYATGTLQSLNDACNVIISNLDHVFENLDDYS